MSVVPAQPEIDERLRLAPRTSARIDGEGRLQLACGPRRFALGPLYPEVAAQLDRLSGLGTSWAELAALDGGSGSAQLRMVVERLAARGWIERTVRFRGQPLASLRPMRSPSPEATPGVGSAGQLVLSRFAYLRRDGDELVVESPRSAATVALHDPRAVAVVGTLAGPAGRNGGGAVAGDLPDAVISSVVGLLADAHLVVGVTGGAEAGEEHDTLPLAQWSFADLVFHAASRYGRQPGGYGGTFPLQGRFEPLPARKAPIGDSIALPPPDDTVPWSEGMPLGAVLERRRSQRSHDDRHPITVAQLGGFLYRSAGVGGAGEAAHRPYPSGGGLYELELYPAVSRCAGLDPALYHYDPIDHTLATVGQGPAVQRLLDDSRGRSLMARTPQVLIVVAARFGRVMYKYESIAYSVILKNVGALFQTMYCVATAMGLAPCALGGGSSDAFCDATGLDYYTESSVGEFLIGSMTTEGQR